MSTRRRNPNGNCSSNHSGEDVSIWRDLYQRLNQLIAAQDRTSQSALQVIRLPIPHEITHDSLDTLSGHVADELGILDVCLERLGILIALREAPPDPPLQGRSTKKRRLEPASSVGSDRGVSPLASTSTSNSQTQVASEQLNANSPASRISSPIPLSSLPPMFTQTQTRSQVGSRSSTPISDGSTSKKTDSSSTISARPTSFRVDRRIAFRDQLPLLPGRLVAFKRPRKPSDTAGDDYWIMAKVVKCISGDRNRYEVEDVDEEGRMNSKQFSWNTTLKSIIPLPVKDQPDTYPPAPLPPGTTVLGLYPETTSFYRGKVKSAPSDRVRRYKIIFDDDEANGPINVVMEHLVPIP
ncbi:hypothetical protein MJO28_001568 [Puccinia striiformis f. sp. tritici]|uniref:SGF29 C-terminal domain-containing protein n=3 Tax=Puccinia striiformis f. sp. tritici TaxID=168172 RepID=A0A0L0W572_9BASI|nr:uncharacterized protein Pst134EA_031488 [Puccinia striiformis f. sp. tritici]KAI9624452.1 hypothetical protein H4Q26_016853 [Puccinia striiformis f. sp. tritici PST-130]KNF06612.1 hypothetical protein PSTG_00486 [Puccinia striiformis f. sp. tritici PST-78]KAH9445264.1 hypothetical protein Pst134EA_031488 [Puccinia striiformis f. sp. tritici]KAH9464730.1 hypothetical protein Pst134EB_004245 [Puccinia striiformis f. sp. tritici]KAI7961076.1 hypothetical protein MJO28_001565 [Puccinia striifor